jgi:DNA-binding NarL/FixJ family response regulator
MADDDDDDCARRRSFEIRGAGAIHWVRWNSTDGPSLPSPLPSLILLDLNMPGKTGAGLEIKSVPHFKVSLSCAPTSREERHRFQPRNEADSFITKPSSFGDWVKIIQSLKDAILLPNGIDHCE